MAILALFDHLDQELDGWLVHSENYQALNTLLPKFRGRVKTIYIDPPYNTGNDDFIYNDRFRHSSWLTMMENRLRLVQDIVRKDGGLFVSVDYNEDANLRHLLDGIYGPQNYRNTIVVSRVKKNIMEHSHVKALNWGHGYLLFYAASEETVIIPPRKFLQNGKKERWHAFDAPGVRPTMEYELFGKKPPLNRHWMYSQERAMEMVRRGEIRLNPKSGRVEYKVPESEGILLDTSWVDLIESDSKWGFPTEKNVSFVQRLLSMLVGKEDDIVLDFFAGSGTTGHAVINLNREDGDWRKYILVEVNDYFHTVLLPRIKKVVFSDKWQDGKPQPDGKGISHFVKYFRLEQYEEVLRRAHYQDDEAPLFVQDDPYTQYVFLRDPKMLDNAETGERVMEVSLEQNEIRVDLSRLYPDIDLAESLSCLTGKWIHRIHPAQDDPSRPGVVEFGDGTKLNLQNPPWEWVKPLIWW
jgi:16S rRNA G966 N2-methylase RsmD